MSKAAWALVIGIIALGALVLGASLLVPFAGRMFGFGFFRPGLFGLGLPFLLLRGGGMLLFWLLIIVGVIWLFQSSRNKSQTSGEAPAQLASPLDVLKLRYARGEITKEQYEEMKNTLGA